MRKILIFVSIFTPVLLFAQKITVSGYVLDAKTKEPITGAVIANLYDNNIAVSNSYGFYSIRVKSGAANKLRVTFIGYDTSYYSLNSTKDTEVNFFLTKGVKISGVTVLGRKSENLSQYNVTQTEIKSLPSLTGDFDVLKSFQYMPGIQFGAEGTSNLYILGGTPDQNLITIDDIPLLYVNHYENIVSVFDIESIREAKLIKSGFHPKYGGKQSGFVDIILKNGDMNKHNFVVSTGVLSTKLSSNGYIIKDKLSYTVSYRRSILDLGQQIMRLIDKEFYATIINFYDITAKLNYNLSANSKLQFLIYSGEDKYKASSKSTDNTGVATIPDLDDNGNFGDNLYKFKEKDSWGNFAYGAKWVYNKNNFFANTTAGFTRYHYNFFIYNETSTKSDSLIRSSIINKKSYIGYYFAKTNCNFMINNHFQLYFGGEYDYFINLPSFFSNKTYTYYSSYYYENSTKEYYGNLFAAFVDLNYDFRDLMFFKAGLRTTLFNGQVYHSPRIRLSVRPSKKIELYASYTKMFQFTHLLQSSVIMKPTDIWILSRGDAIAENSKLFDLSFSYSPSDKFNLTLGGFDKQMYNLIDYKQYVLSITSSLWDRLEYNGTGHAYGMYFSGNYGSKKLSARVTYSYTDNTRLFENLNNGKPFPNYFSRKHYASTIAVYRINKHWQTSALFVFASGMPFTVPEASYNTVAQMYYFYPSPTTFNAFASKEIYELELFSFDAINNYTLPVYHRLDLSCKYSWESKKRNLKNDITFSIYNVYNRMNVYWVYSEIDNNQQIKFYKYTLFPILPSIAYTVRF